VREEAALICAIAASDGDHWLSYDDIADALGIDALAPVNLAYDAWNWAVETSPDSYTQVECDALAEALLRTGWTPS